MLQLNLPPFEYKVKKEGEKTYIFDIFRKKYIVLTPEEWVRQHIGHLLMANQYPSSLIKLEAGMVYNKLAKRTDIRVFDRKGNLFMLVECKAPEIKIDDKVIAQTSMYAKTLKPPFIFITNGIAHFIFEMDYENGVSKPLKSLPNFN